MTSQAKIEANRRNSLKSTGPNTPEGRSKSSMNALKHGMRSKRLAFLREDSFAFENRRQKWMASADPDDDTGEFLVHQYVCLSFELEQVERAHLEHFTSLIENADESELDAVHDLGKRLLFDPTGPTPLYGNPPDARGKRMTSWNGLPVDPNDPALLARKAESSEVGCRWLRERWEELRATGARQILAITRSAQGHSAAGPAAARRHRRSARRRDFRRQPCPQSSRAQRL